MPLTTRDAIQLTPQGLYCPAGDFHIDPWKPVPRAIITHAHADHFAHNCQRYLTSPTGKPPLAARLSPNPNRNPNTDPNPKATIDTIPWRTPTRVGDTLITLHPAGHILGSAQVHIQHAPRHPAANAGTPTPPTAIVTGDHAATAPHTPPHNAPIPHLTPTDHPPERFEPVPCHLFITESTFGLPIFRWQDPETIRHDINTWWQANRDAERTSVVFAYALGKAQRVLAMLDPAIGPIALHGSATKPTDAYRTLGITLPPTTHANNDTRAELKGNALIIAPASTDGTPWLRKFQGPNGTRTAFASGWMAVRGRRRWRAGDRGFVLSDHADWPGLLHSIKESHAERVGVTHGSTQQLARFLREERQLDAFPIETHFKGETDAPQSATPDGPAEQPPTKAAPNEHTTSKDTPNATLR